MRARCVTLRTLPRAGRVWKHTDPHAGSPVARVRPARRVGTSRPSTTVDTRSEGLMDRLDPQTTSRDASGRLGGVPTGAFDPWTFRDEAGVTGSDLVGYKVEATDGGIGKIDECQPRGQLQLPGGRHRRVDLRQEGHAARRHGQPRRPRRPQGRTSTGARTRSRPLRSTTTTRTPTRPTGRSSAATTATPTARRAAARPDRLSVRGGGHRHRVGRSAVVGSTPVPGVQRPTVAGPRIGRTLGDSSVASVATVISTPRRSAPASPRTPTPPGRRQQPDRAEHERAQRVVGADP